jgi:WD40 repeat protein
VPAFSTFHPSAGWCAAQSDEGRYLALAQDSTIDVWETTGMKRHHVLSGHTNTIRALAFCPDGLLASGADDRTIRLWDVEKEIELRTYRGHGGGVTGLAVTADGKRLVSGSKDRNVKVWDLTHESGVFSFQGLNGGEYLYNLTFTGDSRHLLVVHPQVQPADRHQIRAWNVNTESIHILSSFKKMEAPPPYQIFVWSGDGERLAGNDNKTPNIIITWDSATGEEVARLHSRLAEARPLALSHDGRQIVFSGHTIKPAEKGLPIVSELCLADVESGQVVQVFSIPPRRITSGAFSGDGSRLAVAASEMLQKKEGIVPSPTTEIHVFDTTTGRPVAVFAPAHDAPARGLAFSPDGRQLATAGFDGKVHLWDLTTHRDVFPPRQSSGELTSVAFSPDGQRLAATGMDSLVRLWDAHTGHDLLVLKGFGRPGTGHYAFTARVVFSPDGRYLAANAWDATVNIWDAGKSLTSDH